MNPLNVYINYVIIYINKTGFMFVGVFVCLFVFLSRKNRFQVHDVLRLHAEVNSRTDSR